MLGSKKIIFGAIAALVFTTSLGTIGWLIKKKIDEGRGQQESKLAKSQPSYRNTGESQLKPSAPVEAPMNFETKEDAQKALDAMEHSDAGFEEDIE